MNKKKIVFLVGPTATGKSEIAVSLARKIDAEIVSCDSMQVYRNMDIVTAMPAPSLRKKVRHYLMAMLPPCREYDVSQYRSDALGAVREIIRRNKVPLFVGGTGLYMSVLIDGLFPEAGKDPAVRARLSEQARQKGSAWLHARLKKIDPEAACKIHPHDAKRIIRALEVYRTTGKRISQLQKERSGLWDQYDVKIFCLSMERGDLYRRIEERVDRMFRQGLVREVKALTASKMGATAGFAIGIREVKGYLDGAYSLAQARQLVKLNSRRYAKRQLTWFRKDKRIQWVPVSDKEPPRRVALRLWKKLS